MFCQSLILVTVFTILSICTCYPSQFYSFGSGAGDSELPANDDGSTPSIPIAVSFPFFGSTYNSIFVNNNEDITFERPLRQYTSEPFPINGTHKIIAPFWTDIDTTEGGTFLATWMMIMTWDNVAMYQCSSSGSISCQQRNTFQLVLITDGVHSFAVFNYHKVTWTKSTQVGFNAGDGVNFFSVPGSMTDTVLNLPQMSNIMIPGQFVFRVDQAKITNADVINECNSSPCVHGRCSNAYLRYECICDQGYSGVNCETDIDECASSPCVHGACADRINGYVCNCIPGYSGIHCEIDINECASSPCIHGNCTDLVNGYTCQCLLGYTGIVCETDIDECLSSPCKHGICIDKVNEYRCVCETGYYGRQCSEFNFTYLVPLLVGLPLLLAAIILYLLWRRHKRDIFEDSSGVIYFSDANLGPSKTSFRQRTQRLSTFTRVSGFTYQLLQKIMTSKTTQQSSKIHVFPGNSPKNIKV